METIQMKVIARIRSDFPTKFGIPRQSGIVPVISTVVFEPEYRVDEEKMEAYVGSNYENAIWEEFGTGQYALDGNGRKTPWVYEGSDGKMHWTRGKRPSRALYHAFRQTKDKIQRELERRLGGLK